MTLVTLASFMYVCLVQCHGILCAWVLGVIMASLPCGGRMGSDLSLVPNPIGIDET